MHIEHLFDIFESTHNFTRNFSFKSIRAYVVSKPPPSNHYRQIYISTLVSRFGLLESPTLPVTNSKETVCEFVAKSHLEN